MKHADLLKLIKLRLSLFLHSLILHRLPFAHVRDAVGEVRAILAPNSSFRIRSFPWPIHFGMVEDVDRWVAQFTAGSEEVQGDEEVQETPQDPLSLARLLFERGARLGWDWTDTSPLIAKGKMESELEELIEAFDRGDAAAVAMQEAVDRELKILDGLAR